MFSINVPIRSLSASTGLPDYGASPSSEKSPARNFANHFLTQSISHSTFCIHCTSLFTFLEIIKPNMLKMCIFFHMKMAAQKFTNFVFFLMHADMPAVTIRSKEIVSNAVKDN